MAVKEVISSERSYLRHLEIIQEYFATPLEELKILSHKDFVTIFGDIPCILQVNKELLNCLETSEDRVGLVFLQLAPYLKFYSTYASDFERAAQLVEKWNTKSKAFKAFVCSQESRPEVQLKLNSLLITPIQRIPRYKMLLEDVIKKTPDKHPDKDALKQALQQIGDVAQHIEERLKEYEMTKVMLNIQNSLAGGQPNIIAPGRKLLKQGKLMKVPRAGGTHGQHRYFVLFSDILMYCKLKYGLPNNWSPPRAGALECGCVLPLKAIKAEMVVGKGVFKLSCQKEELILYSVEGGSAQDWVDSINQAIEMYKKNAATLRKESSKREPLRRPDLMKMRRESLSQLMRYRLVEGKNKFIHHVTPNSSLKNKSVNTSILRDQNHIDASPKLKSARKRKLNETPTTNAKSSLVSSSMSDINQQENMDMGSSPRGEKDCVKRRKDTTADHKSQTPARTNIPNAPELTPQSQVQLRAKSGKNGHRSKFKTLSLRSFTNFKQVCITVCTSGGGGDQYGKFYSYILPKVGPTICA
jgi:hypothetical protein